MTRAGGSGRRRSPRATSARAAFVLLLPALPMLAGWSFFDPFHKEVEKGNGLAGEGEHDAALHHYDEASRLDPGSPIPDFNRGIVLSGQGKAQEAGDAFLGAAAAEDPRVAADALYNLGNVLLEAQQYEPAVEAYLSSLDLDPEDADARRNLEIAWKRLEEQQQQQQQQNQDQQNQDQDQQDQDQQSQDQQQQDQQPQDEQDQQDDPQPEQQTPQDEEQEQPQEGEQPQDDQSPAQPDEEQQPPSPQEMMSREDAERLLNAVQSDELKVLQKLQEDAEKDAGGVTDDW